MKKRLTALAALCALLLTGCSSMLEREFVSITPHNSAPTTDGDPSTLRADSYQELVNALVYLVDQGQSTGTIRLYTDWEDVAGHMDSACVEVVSEDPLGAYAVNHIDFELTPLVTYSEAQVSIDYRRTPEQIDSIISVTGTTATRAALKSALQRYAPECVMRIGYFQRDEEFIRSLTRQAFYDDPLSALDYPDMEVSVYPDEGRQRIVELVFDYHLTAEELQARKSVVKQELIQLARTVPYSSGAPYVRVAAHALLKQTAFEPGGGSTAWHALTEGKADSEGLALAFAALCQQLRIPCKVAIGTLGGEPHFWNVVSIGEVWRHMDLSLDSDGMATDDEAEALGYHWPNSSLPKCKSIRKPS